MQLALRGLLHLAKRVFSAATGCLEASTWNLVGIDQVVSCRFSSCLRKRTVYDGVQNHAF